MMGSTASMLAGTHWRYAIKVLAAQRSHDRVAAKMLCKASRPLLVNLRSSLRPCTSWLHIWKCSLGQPNRPLHT
jgi:hypothetical protein